MIRAIIFDLDNCLAAANEVGDHLLAPVFEAVRAANGGTLDDASLSRAFADCWKHPLDWVADKHGFSPEMRAAGWRAYAAVEVQEPMHGYGDLAVLAELPVMRFLVTSGFARLQQSKIDALDLDRLCTAVYIDAVDDPERLGKQGLFELILRTHRLRPAQVLVVGDNADSEIAAGNRLGMPTVQILRPGVARTDSAKAHIRSLAELRQLIPGTVTNFLP